MEATKKRSNVFLKLLQERTFSLFLTLVIVIALCGLAWPDQFFTTSNFKSVLINVAIRAILAVGTMNLMISGYIDLSIGSVLALSGGVAAALIVWQGVDPALAIAIALALGCVIGLINGVMVACVGINPMIQTLAMQSICYGLVLVIAGATISGLPKSYTWLGQATFLGIQAPIWFMFIIVALLTFLSEKTVFFKRNYYIGGNSRAASLSGINVNRMVIVNYVIMGFLAAFAGVLTSARLGVASSNAGTSLEMKCICASVLGGASMRGGEGHVIGAVLGIIFMGLLDNILVIAGIPVEWNQVVTGGVLAFAVTMDVLLKKKKL